MRCLNCFCRVRLLHPADSAQRAWQTHSAQEVVAGVLAVELASAVEAEVAAHAVREGRGALAAGLGGEERGTALLAGEADVGSRARVACCVAPPRPEAPASAHARGPAVRRPHPPAATRTPGCCCHRAPWRPCVRRAARGHARRSARGCSTRDAAAHTRSTPAGCARTRTRSRRWPASDAGDEEARARVASTRRGSCARRARQKLPAASGGRGRRARRDRRSGRWCRRRGPPASSCRGSRKPLLPLCGALFPSECDTAGHRPVPWYQKWYKVNWRINSYRCFCLKFVV